MARTQPHDHELRDAERVYAALLTNAGPDRIDSDGAPIIERGEVLRAELDGVVLSLEYVTGTTAYTVRITAQVLCEQTEGADTAQCEGPQYYGARLFGGHFTATTARNGRLLTTGASADDRETLRERIRDAAWRVCLRADAERLRRYWIGKAADLAETIETRTNEQHTRRHGLQTMTERDTAEWHNVLQAATTDADLAGIRFAERFGGYQRQAYTGHKAPRKRDRDAERAAAMAV